MRKRSPRSSPPCASDDAKIGQNTSALAAKIEALRREALLANPLLDFDKLLLVRRREDRMGLPQNWQGNCSLPPHGYDNEIAVLSPVRPGGKLTTLFQPEKTGLRGRRGTALRRREDALFDAQRQRPLAGL